LLDWLARELIAHDYDLKHVARLILNSHAYQREARPDPPNVQDPAERHFAAAARRRMTAEQLVDSLFTAVGKELGSEELCLDVDGRRPITEFINLGTPRRAWEFTSLSNERHRPALSLPVAQSIVDLLTTFAWRESLTCPRCRFRKRSHARTLGPNWDPGTNSFGCRLRTALRSIPTAIVHPPFVLRTRTYQGSQGTVAEGREDCPRPCHGLCAPHGPLATGCTSW
jgi:hypothetical protein